MLPTFSHLYFYASGRATPTAAKLPLGRLFKGVDTAFLRTSWTDPKGTFVGFKGGDNSVAHSHLDLGTFVIDSEGTRWASDLGPDDYNLPGYFGDNRYSYFRLKTEAHNTLTIDNKNQPKTAVAPISDFSINKQRQYAIANLTGAYNKDCAKALRGIKLLETETVVIQDELEALHPVSMTWHFHTPAQIELSEDGRTVTLSKATEGGTNNFTGRFLLRQLQSSAPCTRSTKPVKRTKQFKRKVFRNRNRSQASSI